ncbi:hypothetical protein BIWAKO_05913 [Bosea sp. BIWAKO-01]|nr:hypothetical protein BIWAKO_05913 [Bosea sp. BIWAKO-01]
MDPGFHGRLQARTSASTDLNPDAPETGRNEAAGERPL